MNELRNKIIDAIYERWCEMDFPKSRSFKNLDLEEVINEITKHLRVSGKDALFVESSITAFVCDREECAFKDGFYICLELMNGNIFYTLYEKNNILPYRKG